MTQTITLTNDGDWVAVKGDHKRNILSFNVLGTFGTASLVGTTSLEIDTNNNIIRPVTFRDGNGTQVEITQDTQFGISATTRDRWYIFTVQNSGGTSIEIDYTGKSVSEVKTNVI